MEDIYVITSKSVIKKQDAIDGFVREISTKEELEELIDLQPDVLVGTAGVFFAQKGGERNATKSILKNSICA